MLASIAFMQHSVAQHVQRHANLSNNPALLVNQTAILPLTQAQLVDHMYHNASCHAGRTRRHLLARHCWHWSIPSPLEGSCAYLIDILRRVIFEINWAPDLQIGLSIQIGGFDEAHLHQSCKH